MPLAEGAREIFTITTPLGLLTPTRVPQGVLNATAYFQGVMTELLVGIKCKIWVEMCFFMPTLKMNSWTPSMKSWIV